MQPRPGRAHCRPNEVTMPVELRNRRATG
jgi:hypothetical protein